MGLLFGDARGELQRRPGHGPQRLALPAGVGPAQQQRGLQGQGRGPPLPRAHTGFPGPCVDGRDPCAVQQGQRPVGLVGGQGGGKSLHRQGRQMHGHPAGRWSHGFTTAPDRSARRRCKAGFKRKHGR